MNPRSDSTEADQAAGVPWPPEIQRGLAEVAVYQLGRSMLPVVDMTDDPVKPLCTELHGQELAHSMHWLGEDLQKVREVARWLAGPASPVPVQVPACLQIWRSVQQASIKQAREMLGRPNLPVCSREYWAWLQQTAEGHLQTLEAALAWLESL